MRIEVEQHEDGATTVSGYNAQDELVLFIHNAASGYTNIDVHAQGVGARFFELADGTITGRHEVALPNLAESFFSVDFTEGSEP